MGLNVWSLFSIANALITLFVFAGIVYYFGRDLIDSFLELITRYKRE